MSAPDRIIVCTKGVVASNFKDGTLFSVQEHADTLGTVEYIRKDAVTDIIQLAREGEIDADLRSLRSRIQSIT